MCAGVWVTASAHTAHSRGAGTGGSPGARCTMENICTVTRKISVHHHIYSGAQPPAHLRDRHDQVSEARQGLHLQPDQEGGGQHQD